jgi:methionine-S-sulfoxide reductase
LGQAAFGMSKMHYAVEGVKETTVGYMGGKIENPSYRDVCSDKTGHVEVVQVKFDPNKVSYKKLLGVFWKIHDPTSLNRQGADFPHTKTRNSCSHISRISRNSREVRHVQEKNRDRNQASHNFL